MVTQQMQANHVEATNYYMIGDNPDSDIAGGNAKNMVTILVKTGVFREDAPTSLNGNSREFPATHVVENFTEAIDLIWKLEGL